MGRRKIVKREAAKDLVRLPSALVPKHLGEEK
jgi:hypothetical protein